MSFDVPGSRRSFRLPDALLVLSVLLGAGCDGGSTLPTPTNPTGCTPASAPNCAYLQVPDPPSCEAGALTADWSDRALTELNRIRALSGLPQVAYSAELEQRTAACALVSAVNESADEEPDGSAQCFSQLAAVGCQRSNLSLFSYSSVEAKRTLNLVAPEEVIRRWLIDDSSDNSLGHRRWLLDPFLDQTAFSMVHTEWATGGAGINKLAATLWVLDEDGSSPVSMDQAFVAYPYGDYPSNLFDSGFYLSFSVLADPSSRAGNAQVDFSQATVTVTGPDGVLSILDQRADNEGEGLPNHLQWLVDDLKFDTPYVVTIAGVITPQGPDTFEYPFRLVSP